MPSRGTRARGQLEALVLGDHGGKIGQSGDRDPHGAEPSMVRLTRVMSRGIAPELRAGDHVRAVIADGVPPTLQIMSSNASPI